MIYEFYYPLVRVRQKKRLISSVDYDRVEAMPSTTREEEAAYKKAKKALGRGYEFFTERSPYYKAITTGILVANGVHPVVVTLLSED